MPIEQRFLPGDLKYADELLHCIGTALKRMKELKHDERAFDFWKKEMDRCIAELQLLREAKKEHDALEQERIKFLHNMPIALEEVKQS